MARYPGRWNLEPTGGGAGYPPLVIQTASGLLFLTAFLALSLPFYLTVLSFFPSTTLSLPGTSGSPEYSELSAGAVISAQPILRFSLIPTASLPPLLLFSHCFLPPLVSFLVHLCIRSLVPSVSSDPRVIPRAEG